MSSLEVFGYLREFLEWQVAQTALHVDEFGDLLVGSIRYFLSIFSTCFNFDFVLRGHLLGYCVFLSEGSLD